MDDATERCVGCGAIVPRIDGPIHRYMTSAPGCWAMFGELNAHYLSDPAAVAYRKLCADAYAVQHPGTSGPQAIQSVALHLVSLYGQLELGQPPELTHRVIERGLGLRGRFHWLTPPTSGGARTVAFMLAHLDEPLLAAREWAASAWQAWAAHHDQIRAWHNVLSRLSARSA
jgi:Family of unknown function (DUF5946)